MKVHVYPADRYGCGCYRLIWPAQVLRAQGYDVTIIAPDDPTRSIGGDLDREQNFQLVNVTNVPDDVDVIVMQRLVMAQLSDAVPILRARGIAVVVDMDDDLTAIHPGNIAFTRLNPNNSQTPFFSWANAERACHRATMVTVSTDPLLRIYAPHGRGAVLRNMIPSHHLEIRHVDNETIGWGGSLHSHPDDVPVLGAAMMRLIKENGAQFLSIGDPDGIRQALRLPDEPPTYGPVNIGAWPFALADLGIGIAPLAHTSRFNQAKSWLKPLEMASLGVPWVASPGPEYRRLHELGCGVLAEKPRDWYRELRRLLDDPGRRAEQSTAGRAVARDLTIEGNAWRWMEVWADAWKIQRAAKLTTVIG